MTDQKTEEELWEVEREAMQKFTSCSSSFKANLAWVAGAFVAEYMEALCASLVATCKARDNELISFGIDQDVLDACRVAKLDCKEVLTEHLEKAWNSGTVEISVIVVTYDTYDTRWNCMAKLTTDIVSLA